MPTRRQQIIEMLSKEPISIQHLANLFRVEMREISEDMKHIRQSLKGKTDFIVQPAQCRQCGYVFRERSKIKRPSRCPKCKHERIMPPLFSIRERKHH